MTRAGTSRAFALPLVIILSLVVGLMVAVMLERQTAQSLSVVRQIKGYQSHHTELGVRNLVDGWLKSISPRVLEDIDSEERHILDIRAGDGWTCEIYIGDAQGRVLTNFDGLGGEQLSRARRIARAYRRMGGEPDRTREAGPVEISLRSASRDAILAVAMSVLDDEDLAADFTDRIVTVRDRDDLNDGSAATAAAELGAENDARASLQALLTMTPRLYGVRVVLIGPGQNDPELEFEGLAMFRGGQQGVGQRISKDSEFLSWRPGVPIDDE